MQQSRGKCDRKLYDSITLRNGLEVVLVSNKYGSDCDCRNTTAAAAMYIGGGSFCDPPQIEGLAHFTEHMLFMGSDKYPRENYYDEFISSNGGQCNAYTEGEFTLYNFDVNVTKFSVALDIFAHCFISPLFSRTAVDKELRAVESEFQLAKMSDSARREQLFCQSVLEDHPFRLFSWGNMKSLKATPHAAKIDIIIAMQNYYYQYYHPLNAKLVVFAPLDIAELHSIVVASFDVWAPHSSARAAAPVPIPKLSRSMQCIQPIKRNTHSLRASWIIAPSTMKDYRCKSAEYASHLIGHEGKGSLLQRLKECGYSNNITAGISSSSIFCNSTFSIFCVDVSLTSKGLVNWITVVQELFDYINMIKNSGPQEWIFREQQLLGQLYYDFLDEENESEFAERLAALLSPSRAIPKEDILPSDYILWEYQPSTIQAVIEQLAVEKLHLSLVSSWYENCTRKRTYKDIEDTEMCSCSSEDVDDENDGVENNDEDCGDDEWESCSSENTQCSMVTYDNLYEGKEEYRRLGMPALGTSCSPLITEEKFGIRYWEVVLPEHLIHEWTQSNLRNHFHLPLKNPFIPTDVSLLENPEESQFQRLAGSSTRMRLWYQLDTSFRSPKVELRLHVLTTYTMKSARVAMLNDLWCRCVCDALTETLYLANLADLTSNIVSDDMGIIVHVSGFNDRAMHLLDTILNQFMDHKANYSDIMINRHVEYLKKSYSNCCLNALSAANETRSLCLTPDRFSSSRHLEALESTLPITSNDLCSHATSLLRSELFAKLMVQGNVSEQCTRSLERTVSEKLSLTANLEGLCDLIPSIRVVTVPSGINIAHCSPSSINETNTAVQVYFQCGDFDVRTLAILNLIEHIVEEPYFNELRTNLQMGYDVSCGLRNTFSVLGFYFYVVSSSHSVGDIQSAIWLFATSVECLIQNFSDDVFAGQISALRMKLLSPPNSLQESADEHWRSLEDSHARITNLSRAVASELSNIDRCAVNSFCLQHFSASRVLIVQCDQSSSCTPLLQNGVPIEYNLLCV